MLTESWIQLIKDRKPLIILYSLWAGEDNVIQAVFGKTLAL